MISKKLLGEVLYFGEKGRAYREIYPDCWKFVIVTQSGRRLELNKY